VTESRQSSTNVVIGTASGIGAAVAAMPAPRAPFLIADRDQGLVYAAS
jgi:hypothetical protein